MSDEHDELGKEREEIRKEMDAIQRRMEGGPLTKEEIHQKLEEAKAWLAIIEESQKTREKFGQKLATNFRLEAGNDGASAKVAIADLETAIYGGFLPALRRRLENVERAFQEAQEGSSGHE